jgi:hypothetical protein
MNCHLCESETDFTCDRCGEPVCEECCVKMTIHNQIDYPLCTLCGDAQEIEKAEYYQREREAEEKILKEKEKKAAVRKANYWKHENIEKRRLRKIEQQRLRRELYEKQMANAAKVIAQMFRGLF